MTKKKQKGETLQRRACFPSHTFQRAKALLEMQYKPSEIADILQVNVNTIYRQWIPQGAPHTKDEKGYIWIVGSDLYAWMLAQSRRREGERIPNDHGYCFRCRVARKIQDGHIEPKGHAHFLVGRCPECGTVIMRTVKKESTSD